MAKNKKVYWTTKERTYISDKAYARPVFQKSQKIEINDLDDKHLTNILLLLKRKNNLPGMRITYKRKPDLEQLRTILTEGKFIYCPRHEQVNKMLQETFDKHHGDDANYLEDYEGHYLGYYY